MITIDEAIENLMEISKLDCHIKYPEWQEALRLGIEALKYLQHLREGEWYHSVHIIDNDIPTPPGEIDKYEHNS